MKCIAVDDEKPALDLLEDNISKVPYLELVGKCRNAMEAVKLVREQQVDLIFLDVQMPGLTGLQFVQAMHTRPMVIFITAYEKYALEGFNLDVVDYLLKPVALDRFIKACNKAQARFEYENKPKANLQPAAGADHVFVNVESSLMKVELKDILYVEAFRDYIKLHLTTASQPLITRMSLKSMQDKLPARKFIRIHKSYIIAVQHITLIRRDSVLLSGNELPIGENYKDNIRLLTGS